MKLDLSKQTVDFVVKDDRRKTSTVSTFIEIGNLTKMDSKVTKKMILVDLQNLESCINELHTKATKAIQSIKEDLNLLGDSKN